MLRATFTIRGRSGRILEKGDYHQLDRPNILKKTGLTKNFLFYLTEQIVQ